MECLLSCHPPMTRPTILNSNPRPSLHLSTLITPPSFILFNFFFLFTLFPSSNSTPPPTFPMFQLLFSTLTGKLSSRQPTSFVFIHFPLPHFLPFRNSPIMRVPSSPSSPASLASGSCLAGVLWRIFRPGPLPELPAGHADGEAGEFASEEGGFGAGAATLVPGIVARLMGLEALPPVVRIPGERSPGAVSRSRTVNDLEYREKRGEDGDPRGSVVSASASFSGMPTYLEIESEEFLVLVFEGGAGAEDGEGKKRRKRRRNRTSILERNGRDPPGGNCTTEQNPESSEVSSLALLRNVGDGEGGVVLPGERAGTERESGNSSSPVSVLEFGEFVASELETSASDDWTMADIDLLRLDLGPQSGDISKRMNHARPEVLSRSGDIALYDGAWGYEGETAEVCADVGGRISDDLIDDLIAQLSCSSSSERVRTPER